MPRRRARRHGASARRRSSSRRSCDPATAWWSRSSTGARQSAPATTSSASRRPSWAALRRRMSRRFCFRRGRAFRRLRLAGPKARGHPLPAPRPPASRRRAGALAGPARGVHRPARGRPRRSRGPRDRPLRRVRDQDGRRASRATTWSSSTAAPTVSSRPRTSWRRSPVTSAPAGRRRNCRRSAPSAGRESRRGLGARPASWRASC